ncbi:sodium/hydrogen exchanger 6 [Tanacetum coccineum]
MLVGDGATFSKFDPQSDLLFTRVLDDAKAEFMVRDVSNDEVKSAIFSIRDDRAPGPDGFTAAFFKKAWDVVGGDITCVVRDFLSNGKLLKELNHTIISLIPKVTTPARINDCRPISCCNVLYKCISKIIANRVKEGLGDIVSINQSAFVPGRRISDNILLTQELMRNYHRRRGPPRCAFKVDIQKACDTVDWRFLETILMGFGFHPKMVQWIMVCVSGASYSICVNGNLHGWFKSKRDDFQYYHLCEQQRIINLCFADDLFLFSRGNPSSVAVIMDALKEFKQVSGLVPSIPMSTSFFCNVPNAIKAYILNSMPFAEGVLPVNNGKSTSAWFDRWADVCPLEDMFSNRDIARSGFSLDDPVYNLISEGVWRWPLDWLSSLVSSFYPSSCYTYVVGFSTEIEDTRQGACAFSSHVWSNVRVLCGMDSIPPQIIDVTTFINPIFKGKTTVSILSRLVLADTSYYIWLERNERLFKKKTLSSDQIVDVIISMVRLKLVTFKFKKMSSRSCLLLDQWKIPSYCIVHDGSSR